MTHTERRNKMEYKGLESVFEFKIFFEAGDIQSRFVLAKSEDEAIEKMEAYMEYLKANALEVPIRYSDYPIVDTYCVIV